MECLALHALAPRQDAPGITLSSFKLKNPKNRCLGTMPAGAIANMPTTFYEQPFRLALALFLLLTYVALRWGPGAVGYHQG